MKLSEEGAKFIQSREGCKLKAYEDGGGVWTIGYGHTETAKPGMVISQKQADVLFWRDVNEMTEAVNSLIVVELTQSEFDAIISLVFNIGIPQFKSSTLLEKLNAGDKTAAVGQFQWWRMDNGKVVRGLVKRRQLEAKLFLTGEYTV